MMSWARRLKELVGGALLALTLSSCQPPPSPRSHATPRLPSAPEPAPSPSQVASRQPEPERTAQATIDWSEPVEPKSVDSALRLGRATGALRPPPRCASLLAAAPLLSDCKTPERAKEQLARALSEIGSAILAQERIAEQCRNDAEPPRPSAAPERMAASLDARLRVLESCTGLPPGFVRTLRAELALDCADVLAEDALASGTKFDARYQHALFGLALAARFARTGPKPPAFRPRENLAEAARPFVQDTLLPWLKQREAALTALDASAASLPEQSYGGALARAAAALARLQMHGAYRDVSIPTEFKKDYRLRTSFYSALDDAFTPFVEREARASRAAHRLLEVVGSIWLSAPLDVRPLLRDTSELLSHVVLPRPALPTTENTAVRLALSLPPFYLPEVLSDAELRSSDVLRAMLLRGLAPAARARLRAGTPDREILATLARSELHAALLTSSPRRARRAALHAADVPDERLLLALGQSLASLPDALEAWDKQGPLPLDIGSLARFDSSQRDDAGLARLNAAVLLLAARRFDEAQPLAAQITLPEPAATACREAALGQSMAFRLKRCPCRYVWSRPLDGQGSPLGGP